MKSKGVFGMCSSDYQVTRLLKLLIEVLKNKIFVGKQKCNEISKLNLQYIFWIEVLKNKIFVGKQKCNEISKLNLQYICYYNFWFCRAIANIPAHKNKYFLQQQRVPLHFSAAVVITNCVCVLF